MLTGGGLFFDCVVMGGVVGFVVRTCRHPNSAAAKVPLLDFSQEEATFWLTMGAVLVYSFLVGFFVATERSCSVCVCGVWLCMCVGVPVSVSSAVDTPNRFCLSLYVRVVFPLQATRRRPRAAAI